jgi:hypothetical protein
VEIQRLEYDHHFDRFLHYFLMLIAEQQKTAREYNIDQTVYMIVILTEKYTISEKNGKPIKDEVLLLNFNPQTVRGEIRDLYGHQFVCLNPNHPDKDTPQGIRDWLDLIYQSIHNPERPVLNIENKGIKKAAELINFDNLTPEERAESKNKEAAKVTLAKMEEIARTEERTLAEAEKKALREQAEEERRQKEEALRKQEEERRQKEEALRKQQEALRNSVRMALEFGATEEQIAMKLNLLPQEVERIISELGDL